MKNAVTCLRNNIVSHVSSRLFFRVLPYAMIYAQDE